MVGVAVAVLFLVVSGKVDNSSYREDVIRRFLALPAHKKAEILARWRLLKGIPKEKRHKLIERLRRWLKEPRWRRRALLLRWRRWRALQRSLMRQLPYKKRVALLRLPPWQRNAELAKIFNRHLLQVYKPLVYLFGEEQKKRLLSLPQERFLFEMRRLLKRRFSLACHMALRSLPLPLRKRVKRGEMRPITVLAMRLPRHEKVLKTLRKEQTLGLLKRAPRIARLVETELAWQRIKHSAAEHLSSYLATLPPQKRSLLLKALLENGQPVEDMPKELRTVAILPDEARREILLSLKPPLAPPRGPR